VTTVGILASKRAYEARLLPRCGVPKKMMPAVLVSMLLNRRSFPARMRALDDVSGEFGQDKKGGIGYLFGD
jgi:hypothetical protein